MKEVAPAPSLADSTASDIVEEQVNETLQLEKKQGAKNEVELSGETPGPKKLQEQKEAAATGLATGPETKTEEKTLESVKAEEVIMESAKVVAADQPAELKKESTDALTARSAKLAPTIQTQMTTIVGRVTFEEEGAPVPGVNVIVKGTTQGTVTDADGRYQINISTPNPELTFSFIGFQTKTVPANQSTIDVQLGTDVAQLSEVVVTGFRPGNIDDTHEPVIKLAEPAGGRRAYDKYLQNSLRYPSQALENKIKGKVTVQFTVHVDGSLDEFNILKSLGFGCDEEVIRLVKEGPKWSPTTEDNVPVESEVRVKVKFAPPSGK